jgi:hypothetical protein
MTQTLLETAEDSLVVTRFKIDHAVGIEPHLRRRGEQIGPRDAPQHLALEPGHDAGRNSAAAAPSIAPLPPPATSCNAASAKPPPGSRASTVAMPKGSTDDARRRPALRSLNCLPQSPQRNRR